MPDDQAARARKEAMRQIRRKQAELARPAGLGGRWRLDVPVPKLVLQALAVLALGMLMGAGLHILLKIYVF